MTEETNDFEREIADALLCAPSPRVDAFVHAAAVREAWRNRMRAAFAPRRVAAAAAALIVAGGIAFTSLDRVPVDAEVDFAQSLLDQQGLAEDDFLSTCYCVL